MLEVMAYSSAAVFAPLAIFLSLGFWLDRRWNTHPKFLIVGLAVAFVITNFLLIKKSRSISLGSLRLVKKINSEGKEQDKREEEKFYANKK